ncbi:MAG: hypothetical protein HY301_19175 [Verrucomicrobia bacterium]|nr:hypothetical protein [Verrucomicrobiota bacterium]
MNTKSLIITIVVAFVTVWVTDFLIHVVWLSSSYAATKSLWRPEAEMMSKMPFMLLGQFLVATAFTMIFAACVAEKRCLSCSLKYSACIGILVGAGQIIMYAVAPYPGTLVAKWCVAYIAQVLLLGVVVHKVYKPLLAKQG